jgi:TRAP-type mannitol/chloroaromatic compound transport system permease small subunit
MPPTPVSRVLTRIVDVLVLAAGWWLIVLSVLSCVEMVTRKLFAFSLQGIDEVGGYTLAVTAAIGFSYTLITRGHTRIDFLVSKLPVKGRSALNTLAMVTLMLMAVFAVLRGWIVLSESIEFQSHATTPLQTPMWIPQSMWFTGWLLFALVAVYMAGHSLWLLARGQHDAVNRFYGPQTLDEEIESEAGEVLAQARKAAESAVTTKGAA